MRLYLLAGLLTAAAVLPVPSAEAYEAPWCLQFNNGRSSAERCHFTTFEGCAQERILQGTTAFCHQNPYYLANWQARGGGPEHRVKLARKNKNRR